MSDLIQTFPGRSYEEWVDWYLKGHPEAIDAATKRVSAMIGNFRTALTGVDDAIIKRWVKDLVLVKTFMGLKFQAAILKRVADLMGLPHRLATPGEESKGIDGYIGDIPISIKPDTYGAKPQLVEKLGGKLIVYAKDKKGIIVDYGDLL
jgi:hypothetical protein